LGDGAEVVDASMIGGGCCWAAAAAVADGAVRNKLDGEAKIGGGGRGKDSRLGVVVVAEVSDVVVGRWLITTSCDGWLWFDVVVWVGWVLEEGCVEGNESIVPSNAWLAGGDDGGL
jgi:hypothetical protein